MEVSVLNTSGQEVGRIELPASIFSAKVNRGLMHQALVYQLVNARRGTHKTKTRAEVSRTTAKVYKQKGTGNARHGSKRCRFLWAVVLLTGRNRVIMSSGCRERCAVLRCARRYR